MGKLNSGKQQNYVKIETNDEVPMEEEDEKLFELTKSNTMINRDILNKEKTYLKKIESQYKEIYGDKGIQFCKEEDKNIIDNENNNINNINKTNNNSLTISKSQNKLLNSVSVNLISKLNQNQNIPTDKSNINTSTKNGLNNDTSTQNINKIKGNEIDEENSLNIDTIFEKLKIMEINTTKFFIYLIVCLIIILMIYSIIKLFEAYDYFYKAKNLFNDYSIVTFEYSMIINYFNNLNIILINQPIGYEDLLENMQNRVEEQFKKSEEVKKKSLKNYPKITKIFDILNSAEDTYRIKDLLCQEEQACMVIFDSKYNVVQKGIDVGLKTVSQEVYNDFCDYKLLKNDIKELSDVQKYFIKEEFYQIDLSLKFLLSRVEDRCADAFLDEASDLIHSFKTVIISLNVFIIIFLTLISISLIVFIINRITRLINLIKKSSTRISISINSIKEKNFGSKTKSGTLL